MYQGTSQDVHRSRTLPVHTVTITLDVIGPRDLIWTLKGIPVNQNTRLEPQGIYNTYCNVTIQELTTIANNSFFE